MIIRRLYGLSESYPQSVYQNTLARTYGNIMALRTSSSIKANFKRFINAVYNELGILLLAYSGQRSYPEQWELRQKYLAGGPRAALPGYSWHPYGRALDTVPINSDGSANWKTRQWAAIHRIASKFGLEHGGTFSDPGHILYRTGTTLETQRSIYPGWENYATYEKVSGIRKPKDTESPRHFKASRALLWGSIATGLFFGGRYLYRRYGKAV